MFVCVCVAVFAYVCFGVLVSVDVCVCCMCVSVCVCVVVRLVESLAYIRAGENLTNYLSASHQHQLFGTRW